ncbi:MAG: type II toxin-antitoxin system HicB family antitoxin [Nodularia sp. (in: Bacteria)]|nr:MAG: type II toxin-antitoxin system HicB family antitoxin [Nodularia sp. (in: cyanobacteria)]
MNFYTVVLRQSFGSWVGLCLENGVVGQGDTQEDAVNKLKEAIESFEDVYESEDNIYKSPISIDELHEFLLVEEKENQSEIYELRKVYA